MLGAVLNKLVRTLPMVTEEEAREQAVLDGATTSIIATLPTIHARELVTMVSSDENVTLVKRIKGLARGITVDRTQAVVGGTNLIDQDTGGFGQEVEILITNASGNTATVSIWAAARM
tara:strand:+ start:1641 stop:1994 length:354 start_codon:yes stop_codon:yes gene_type:complete